MWGFLLLVLMACSGSMRAQKAKANAPKIDWKSFEEVEKLMQTKPKKVLVDLYTNWCGWCKKMDAHIYSNPEVVAYINKHFYAIKFNTEQKEPITFKGKTYTLQQVGRNATNQLAIEMLNGSLSYPTTAFMDEKFQAMAVQPGYLKIQQMESILKYIATNSYKNQDYNTFISGQVFTWK